MMKVRAGLLGLSLVAAACSPFAAAQPEGSESGLDASSPADGGVSPDAPDGGTDAGAPDGSPSVGCEDPAAHDICEDFDRPDPFSAWVRVENPTTPLTLDTQLATSAPNSLRVDVGSSPDLHPSFLQRPFPGQRRIVLQADVVASFSPATDNEIDVLALELDPPASDISRYFVGLIVRSDGKFVLETNLSGAANRKDITSLKTDWSHVTLEVDLSGGRAIATVGDKVTTLNIRQAAGIGGILRIGAAWANNTKGSFRVNIDNLVLDADR
jgi:hypothetical protein